MTEKPQSNYTDSDAYQKEIADQYKERVSKFSREQVLVALEKLGLTKLPDLKDIKEAGAGNMNATYLTPDLVVKLNDKRENPDYWANKIVSDRLGDQSPVVKVLAYDNFEETDFEILVMERAKGTMLMDDIFEMSEDDQKILFRQVMQVINNLSTITFKDFGEINLQGKESYKTYADFLKARFDRDIGKIRTEQLAKPEDIDAIEAHFHNQVSVFDEGESVFVHTDLHMGDILHEGHTLTAVLDFDYSLKAPKMRTLLSLLGFLFNPQQFVEGTKDFAKYKGKNFAHLFAVLKDELGDVFNDSQLVRKLNVLQISEGVMWVSQNWSAGWNQQMIQSLVSRELPKTEADLAKTSYGELLAKSV